MENKEKQERIYLVGVRGEGEKNLGRILAGKLGYDFFDTDRQFEEKYKTTVDLFFKKYGEDVFRKLEYELLQSTFQLDKVVISTGGGTPCFFDSMDMINRHGTSIYLQMPPKALYSRLIHAKKLRPLVAKKSNEELLKFIEEKLAEREKFYKQAHYIITGLSPDVEFIAQMLKEKIDSGK